MIVTTGNEVADHNIREYLGIVRGIVVRAPTMSQNIVGGFKSILGGHIEEFTEVCERARLEAYDRMVQHA